MEHAPAGSPGSRQLVPPASAASSPSLKNAFGGMNEVETQQSEVSIEKSIRYRIERSSDLDYTQTLKPKFSNFVVFPDFPKEHLPSPIQDCLDFVEVSWCTTN